MDRSRQRGKRRARGANTGQVRKKRAGRGGAFRVAALLFFLSAGVVLCLTVFFKIESVYVIGTDRYDPVEMADVSGVEIGGNLFRISKKDITERILKAYPYIVDVEIGRKLPPSVEISVKQCEPEGAIKEKNGEYVLITRAGKVLERGLMYIPENIPLIIGLDTMDAQPGEYIGSVKKLDKPEGEDEEGKKRREEEDRANAEKAKAASEALVMVDYLFAAMEESGFTDIANVDISDRLNMRVMYENRLLLELGSEAELAYKLEFVRRIIDKELEPGEKGTLYAADLIRKKRVLFSPAKGSVREYPLSTEAEEEEPAQ